MTLVADWNSSVNVPFQRMRQMLLDGALQEGVVGANDFMVVQRGAGANMSVDVGTGFAWVQIDTGTRNGMGHVTNDAVANLAIAAAHATNPRIDQVVLRWNDSSIPTGTGNVPTLEVLTGTATSGATLDNRTGAAALGNDRLRLADVLVPATDTTITNNQIRDRRPWARGLYNRVLHSAGDETTTSTTMVAIAALQRRYECSGAPLRVKLKTVVFNSTAGNGVDLDVSVDGVQIGQRAELTSAIASARVPVNAVFEFTPAAGSHVITATFLSTPSGTITMLASGNYPTEFVIEEVVRQNTANNTITSG